MIEGRCQNLGAVLMDGNHLMLHSVMMRVLTEAQVTEIKNMYNRQKVLSLKGQNEAL